MNRTLVATAALLLGLGIAAPQPVSAGDDETRLAQAGQGQPGAGMGMMGQPGASMGMGMMGQHGGMGRMMHRMMQLPPRQRCEERLARRAGIVAYTVAKLNLTAEQKPLWDKLQAQLQSAAERERQLCAGLKPASERSQETVLDRVGRREQFLAARLQGLQQAKPALEQFYQALTPEQKAIVNHPFPHH
jgi:hypothetical protein